MIGAHLLRLGEAWFINGSKSILLFRVAPQAIALNCVLIAKIEINKFPVMSGNGRTGPPVCDANAS